MRSTEAASNQKSFHGGFRAKFVFHFCRYFSASLFSKTAFTRPRGRPLQQGAADSRLCRKESFPILLMMKRATKYSGILIGKCLLCSCTLSAAGAGDVEEDPSFSLSRLNIAGSPCSRVPFDSHASITFIKGRPSSTISRVGWSWECNRCAISISCYFAVVLAITFLMLMCFRTLGRSPTLTPKSRILGEDPVVENHQCIVSPCPETPALVQTHNDINAPSEFLRRIRLLKQAPRCLQAETNAPSA